MIRLIRFYPTRSTEYLFKMLSRYVVPNMIHRRYAPITYSRSPHNSFTIFRNKKLLFLSGRSQYTPERRRFDPVYKYTYGVGIILHTCLLLYLFSSLIPSFLFLFFFRGDETDPSKHTPSQQWRECGEIDPL